jgi:signal peptidase I
MKKVLIFIKNVLVWALALVAVGMMIFTIVSVTFFDRSDRDLLGYKAFIVLSDSMSATDFDAGDVVLVKSVDPTTLQEGDIISYVSQNSSNFGETVTHKIRSLTTDANGDPGFVTYGTTTNSDDETVVTYPYVIGKYQFRLPKVGTFFTFLKTTPGYICCILIPFVALMLYQGINCIVLFRQYKAEQMEEVEAERAQLDAERRQSAEMMAELMALKAQMAAATVPTGAPAASPVSPAAPPAAQPIAPVTPTYQPPIYQAPAAPVAPAPAPAAAAPDTAQPDLGNPMSAAVEPTMPDMVNPSPAAAEPAASTTPLASPAAAAGDETGKEIST